MFVNSYKHFLNGIWRDTGKYIVPHYINEKKLKERAYHNRNNVIILHVRLTVFVKKMQMKNAGASDFTIS